jgi:exopolysaccharide biosynthesis polyprenyl glycosylphosphotransferase
MRLHHGDMINESGARLSGLTASQAASTTLPSMRLAEQSERCGQVSSLHWRLGLAAADLLIGLGAMMLASVARFGVSNPTGPGPLYSLLILAVPPGWVIILAACGTYNRHRLSTGGAEFGRVGNAGLWLLAALVGGSYLGHADISRQVVAVGWVEITAGSLAVHLLGRSLLHRRLRGGAALGQVLVVGSQREATGLAAHIRRLPGSGLRVAANLVGDRGRRQGETPGTERVAEILTAARRVGADTIAIGASALNGEELRRLSWDLEGTGIELLVASGAPELAGPRLLTHRVGGLPLVHVREAAFSGPGLFMKEVVDRTTALCAGVLLSPLLLGCIIAVRMSGPGPIFFRQPRVGRHGRSFQVIKLRTMHPGAECRQAELAALNESDGVLFKMRLDPRVTRVGRVLRRFSFDELPQLWNVLRGEMSLVGPRPPLATEVEKYPADLRRRRLLVKPGITGLWQVGGRADLSWEDAVRLDLQYVDNWSVRLDLLIMWQTLQVVVNGRGAY